MTPLCGRKRRRTKEPLDESERGEWKSWLKTQHSKNEDYVIRSHYFMANRWENNGNSDCIFLSSKITVGCDCSHEIKRHLVLERKTMTNLDSILKGKDITLPTKFHIVKAVVFPVVIWMWELDHKEGWVSTKGLMLSICVVGEYNWESHQQQGDQTSQS